MNTMSLLRNAFVALSLGAFLIPNAFSAQGDVADDEQGQHPVASRSLSLTEPAQDKDPKTLAPIQQLPEEILKRIFFFLDIKELGRTNRACHQFHSIITEPLRVYRFLHALQIPGIYAKKKMLSNTPCMRLRVEPDFFADKILSIDDYAGVLPKGIFDKLENLKVLGLNGYRGTLPEGVFDKLGSLKSLSLNDYTVDLPDGIFDALGSLSSLELRNYTGILPEDVFDDLELLKLLELNDYTGDLPEVLVKTLSDRLVIVML